jgi:hypothetical protein
MATIPSALGAGFLSRFLTRITTHKLAAIVGVLFLLDFVTPDPIPFIDELVLGLLTLLLARWQGRHSSPEPTPAARQPYKDVTPR